MMHSSLNSMAENYFMILVQLEFPIRHVLGYSYIHFFLHLVKVKETDPNLESMQPSSFI